MTDDAELLRRFVEKSSEAAFRDLVARRIDFVYAAALRQVGGDEHLADEVVQSVFLELARKGRALTQRPSLTGWLFTSTRFAAANALRSRARRMNHEKKAQAMNEIPSSGPATEIDWNDLRPVLDAAMHELGEKDREAVLLRYFDGRSLAAVGAGLGLSENSARMRVERALEKLHVRLARRGIISTVAALGLALARQPAISAPASLAATVAGTSLAAAAVAGGGLTLVGATMTIRNTIKLAVGALGVIAALGLGTYFGMHYQARRAAAADAAQAVARAGQLSTLREENLRLRDDLAQQRADKAALMAAHLVDARGAHEATGATTLGQWRMLADLAQKKMIDPRITFVSPNGKLNEAFATLFALTPTETDALQQGLDKAGQTLAELEREHATVSRDDKGTVTIAIKPFADTGGAVYDELMKTFAETLGAERNTAYVALGAEQVEKALGNFGAVERTVKFTYDPAYAGGPFKVSEATSTGLGNHSDWSSTYPSLQDVLNRYGTVTQLLPPDFGGGK